jgi:hypothetical protein
MPRLNTFTNKNSELLHLVPSTVKRVAIQRLALYPEAKPVESFQSTVVHSDGSTFTCSLTLPFQERINLVKDNVNHILWNPRVSLSRSSVTTEALSKFNKRSGIDSDMLANLAYDEHGVAPVLASTAKNSKGKGKKK